MTPPNATAHERLAAWVHEGNGLMLFGMANGPYETLPGWWNEPGERHGPWPHLHALLGITDRPGLHKVGAGMAMLVAEGPIDLARQSEGATKVRGYLRAALEALGPGAPPYREQGYMTMRRGQYLLAAGMTAPASSAGEELARISGHFIDMFDGDLALRDGIGVQAGRYAFLLDLDRVPRDTPAVLAASGRVTNVTAQPRALRFTISGPANTWAVTRVALPAAPNVARAGGDGISFSWDQGTQTVLLKHPNAPDGVTYSVAW
jgi:hypothetical protein